MLAEKISGGLYRILVPFERITTTVYLAVYESGVGVIDSATYPEDAEQYILPALGELGLAPEDVTWLLLTHTHGDHAGGLGRLSALIPEAKIGFFSELSMPRFQRIRDGEVLLGGLQVVHLPGHTQDCVGYLDTKTKTLLSGDCLQLEGVDIYRSGVQYPTLYRASVNKLKGMDILRIVAAHEYDPLGSIAQGREAVGQYLEHCLFASQLP